jgi:hypothetical protein
MAQVSNLCLEHKALSSNLSAKKKKPPSTCVHIYFISVLSTIAVSLLHVFSM